MTNIPWRLSYCILTTFIVMIAAPTTACAWMLWTHTSITNDALDRANWTNDDAREIVKRCNKATDLVDLESTTLNVICPWSRDRMPDVANIVGDARFNHYPGQTRSIGSHGFHFDNLCDFTQVKERWNDLRAFVQLQAAAVQRDALTWNATGRERWLCTIGIMLHAVQDFYCHSNWVILTAAYGAQSMADPADLPTWEELYEEPTATQWAKAHAKPNGPFDVQNAKKNIEQTTGKPDADEIGVGVVNPGLQTGRWEANNCRGGWEHRHQGWRTEFDKYWLSRAFGTYDAPAQEDKAAIALANRASDYWLAYMRSLLNGPCATDFDTYVQRAHDADTTDCFDYAISSFRNVLRYFCGPSGRAEIATFATRGMASRSMYLEDYAPSEGTVDTSAGATVYTWAADSMVWQHVVYALCPIPTAQEYIDAGQLIIARIGTTEAPGRTLPDDGGTRLSARARKVSDGVRIDLHLPDASPVHIEAIDIRGNRTAVIADGVADAGESAFTWAAANPPAGTYFIAARTRFGTAVCRVTLWP